MEKKTIRNCKRKIQILYVIMLSSLVSIEQVPLAKSILIKIVDELIDTWSRAHWASESTKQNVGSRRRPREQSPRRTRHRARPSNVRSEPPCPMPGLWRSAPREPNYGAYKHWEAIPNFCARAPLSAVPTNPSTKSVRRNTASKISSEY